jgi:hypothetical protein
MMPDPELVAVVDGTVRRRKAKLLANGEILFTCPNANAHTNRDANPSARWNRAKAVWWCDACGAGDGVIDLARRLNVSPPNGRPPQRDYRGRETIYAVRTRDGTLVAEHVRIEDGASGGKRFSWRRPNGRSGLNGVKTADLPLYGVHDLPQGTPALPVVIVEGEKARDALAQRGVCAVGTVTGASGTPSDEVLRLLAGMDVILWPDADAPGRAHMRHIGSRLTALGIGHRLVDPWPDRSDGSDAADWTGAPEVLRALLAPPETGKLELEEPGAIKWDDMRPWPTLEEAALHGLAGDVVRVLDPHTEADAAAMLVTFLVLFGNAAGPGPHARVGAVQHPARLFACVVGATAHARKGQSFAEVGSLFEAADPVWWKAARSGGLASGEGIIARLRDDQERGVEKRALFYEPEFARTLAAAARDKSTLSPVLRDAWDSGTLAVTTRTDPLQATGAHVGVLAHITLEELQARLTSLEIANGFANRFLYVCARRSKKLPSGGTLDDGERHRLGERISVALEQARTLKIVVRTPEAEALWNRVYGNLPEPPGLFGAVTARADAQLLRLQVTYALLEGGQIDVRHLQSAIAVWRYTEASAAHVFGRTIGNDKADRLLDELRAVYPKGLTREAQHALFNRNASAAEINAARTLLTRLGLAVDRPEAGSGRHPWVLYAVRKQTKETKEGETEGLSSFPSSVLEEVEREAPAMDDAPPAPPEGWL